MYGNRTGSRRATSWRTSVPPASATTAAANPVPPSYATSKPAILRGLRTRSCASTSRASSRCSRRRRASVRGPRNSRHPNRARSSTRPPRTVTPSWRSRAAPPGNGTSPEARTRRCEPAVRDSRRSRNTAIAARTSPRASARSANVDTRPAGIWATRSLISRERSIRGRDGAGPRKARPQPFSPARGWAAPDVPPIARRVRRHAERPPRGPPGGRARRGRAGRRGGAGPGLRGAGDRLHEHGGPPRADQHAPPRREHAPPRGGGRRPARGDARDRVRDRRAAHAAGRADGRAPRVHRDVEIRHDVVPRPVLLGGRGRAGRARGRDPRLPVVGRPRRGVHDPAGEPAEERGAVRPEDEGRRARDAVRRSPGRVRGLRGDVGGRPGPRGRPGRGAPRPPRRDPLRGVQPPEEDVPAPRGVAREDWVPL